jgi:putative ABC transport system permease protein
MTPAPTSTPALIMISAMVVVAVLLGLTTMLLSTLNERRREMAILRSVGASPRTVVGLLMIEAGLLSLLGVLLGVSLLYTAGIRVRYGIALTDEARDEAEEAVKPRVWGD